jgi:hypothetical protein
MVIILILNINTSKDVERFNEKVVVKKQLKNSIKNLFRSNRDIDDNNFKNWYYQLIQMYKNVLDTNIFNRQNTRRNKERCWIYTINNDIIENYNFFINLKSNNVTQCLFVAKTP